MPPLQLRQLWSWIPLTLWPERAVSMKIQRTLSIKICWRWVICTRISTIGVKEGGHGGYIPRIYSRMSVARLFANSPPPTALPCEAVQKTLEIMVPLGESKLWLLFFFRYLQLCVLDTPGESPANPRMVFHLPEKRSADQHGICGGAESSYNASTNKTRCYRRDMPYIFTSCIVYVCLCDPDCDLRWSGGASWPFSAAKVTISWDRAGRERESKNSDGSGRGVRPRMYLLYVYPPYKSIPTNPGENRFKTLNLWIYYYAITMRRPLVWFPD